MFLWRISNHLSLTGDGGLRTPGRWHIRGRRVVYCAQSPAAALLEILVHFEIDIQDLPVRYRLLKIEAPEDAHIERIAVDRLPADWPERTEVTRALGDGWLTKGSSALLSVPSAIVPQTFNVLLNPAHQDAKRIVIIETGEHAIDISWVSAPPVGGQPKPFSDPPARAPMAQPIPSTTYAHIS